MKVLTTLKTVPAILTLLGLCLAPAAQAATNTGNLAVSATIETACSVSASPMAFGIVLPGVNSDTEAVVTAVCTSGTTYTLDLGDGLNHTVTGGAGDAEYRRQMASAANRLPYAVYNDAARTTPIAATASAAANNNLLTSTVGNGLDQPVTIYGRVVGTESVSKPPGVYADTVVLTVAF